MIVVCETYRDAVGCPMTDVMVLVVLGAFRTVVRLVSLVTAVPVIM